MEDDTKENPDGVLPKNDHLLYPQASVDPAGQEALLSDVTKHARSAVLWLASTTALWQVVSWGITLITARILDPSDYGLVALAETVMPYLGLVASFHLATWVVQSESISARDEKVLFTMSLALGVTMSALAFLAAPFIAAFYKRPDVLVPFRLISMVFILRGFMILPEALLRRELRFKPLALMNLGTGVSRVVLQLVLALLGFKYWALVLGIVYRDLAAAIWLIAVRGVPHGLAWDSRLAGRALRFGFPATAATVLWVVFSTADNVVVGRFFGVEMLGYYTMAFFLTDLPMSKLNMVVRPVLLPLFSRLKGSPTDLQHTFLVVCRGAIALTYPVLLGMALVAPEAVSVIFGEKWLPMVVPLSVLAIVGLFRAFSDSVPPLFLALGRPGKTLVINALTVALLPAGFFFLGRHFGINGIYMTWLGIYPALSLIIVLMVCPLTNITLLDYLKNLKAPAVACTAMVFAVILTSMVMKPFGTPQVFAAKVIVGAATYAGVMWFRFRRESLEILTLRRGV